MKTLFEVGSSPVVLNDDGSVFFVGEFAIDADGCPQCYHPHGSPPGLDYLANAGHPGNWWGIATGANGKPFIQGPRDPAPGFYVSTTAYKVPGIPGGDPRCYLDSSAVSFIVVPHQLVPAVGPIVLGCKAMVIDPETGLSIPAVVGDIGPGNHLGEGSMAAGAGLRLPTSPKTGGSSDKRFKFLLWPGIPADGFTLEGQRNFLAADRMASLGDVTYV